MSNYYLPFPERASDSHKGSHGRVLVIAGSRGMSGAASLCCRAALRAGAGLVYGAVPDCVADTVASFSEEVIVHPMPDTENGVLFAAAAERIVQIIEELHINVVAIGPGLGRRPETVLAIQRTIQRLDCPIVLDADGLWAYHDDPNVRNPKDVVMTPHPGECSVLLGRDTDNIQADRESAVVDLQSVTKGVVLLKGSETLITNGEEKVRNTTGGPGLATAGTGDVLTGIIAGLIAQGFSPFHAAVTGAWIHGTAGDLATQEVGEVSVIASDVIKHISGAIQRYRVVYGDEE